MRFRSCKLRRYLVFLVLFVAVHLCFYQIYLLFSGWFISALDCTFGASSLAGPACRVVAESKDVTQEKYNLSCGARGYGHFGGGTTRDWQIALDSIRSAKTDSWCAEVAERYSCEKAMCDASGAHSRKYAVFTNAGDFHVVTSWVACSGRKFDLLVNFYGRDETHARELIAVADRFRRGKGHKFNSLVDWLNEEPHLLDSYFAVAVLDDDMQNATTGKINAMFDILMYENLTWASPTFTGQTWQPPSRPDRNYYLRYSSYFDMTFMFWRRQELIGYLRIHIDSLQGHGEEIWAWNFLGRYRLNFCKQKHSAVIDAVVVHNAPFRADGHREHANANTEEKIVDNYIRSGIYTIRGFDPHEPTIPIGGKLANVVPRWIKHEIVRCQV